MAKKKKKGYPAITLDPRYLDFAASYRSRPYAFITDVIGVDLDFQQVSVVNAMTPVGAWVSVASGHGTGKSFLVGCLCLHFMITHPDSMIMITANSLDQVLNGVFSYIKTHWTAICTRQPWLEQYFKLTTKNFYAKGYKGRWHIFGKTCQRGKEEGLAGNHRRDYLVVVDEASGVSDKVFNVLGGALTEDNNKILLISQFTRPIGHFAESQTSLAEAGNYTALTLNSELSRHVNMRFIRNKRIEYGGRDSAEYGIRVLGICPDDVSGFLISRADVNKGFATKIQFDDDEEWGYIATADVAGGVGRDSSVLKISKVSGQGSERKVQVVKLIVAPSTMDGVMFARFIAQEVHGYSNITVAVDADGYGLATCQELSRQGIECVRIRWGKRPHSNALFDRFPLEKDYACVMLRDALKDGRVGLLKGETKTIETELMRQFTKIPYEFDDNGKWKIFSKKRLASEGIKSPDIFDAHAFAWLCDYIPANEGNDEYQEQAIADAMDLLGEDSSVVDDAIAAIEQGKLVVCDDYEYEYEVRDALQQAAGDWIDSGDDELAQVALNEVRRLDELHQYAELV